MEEDDRRNAGQSIPIIVIQLLKMAQLVINHPVGVSGMKHPLAHLMHALRDVDCLVLQTSYLVAENLHESQGIGGWSATQMHRDGAQGGGGEPLLHPLPNRAVHQLGAGIVGRHHVVTVNEHLIGGREGAHPVSARGVLEVGLNDFGLHEMAPAIVDERLVGGKLVAQNILGPTGHRIALDGLFDDRTKRTVKGFIR